MNIQQDIDQQEREFSELLQRVMQHPLSPIANSVKEVDKRLGQLEQNLQDMREIELNALTLSGEDSRKQIRSLKSITEDTPQEVHNAIQPLLVEVRTQLEQSTLQSIQEVLKKLGDHLEHAAQHTSTQIAAIATSASQSQAEMQLFQKQAMEQLEHSFQSTLKYLHTELKETVKNLGLQLSQQSENNQNSLCLLQKMMQRHAKELQEQSATAFEQVTQQAATQLTMASQSMAQLQDVLTEQESQLKLLQEQQFEWPNRLSDQMVRFTQPIRRWLIVSVLLTGAGVAGVVALVAGKF